MTPTPSSTIHNAQDPSRYRPCVGMIMLNSNKQVFVGRRIDNPEEAWQMPQGGIDAGEEPRDAVLRELVEEVGTDKVEILTESKDWYFYDLPPEMQKTLWNGQFLGQRQKWFVMNFTGNDSDINILTDIPEFSEWRWVPSHILPEIIVPFKQNLYQQLVADFASFLK